MNILVIAHYQDDGSPYVSFVHSQTVEFVKQGHNVIVFSPTVLGKRYKYLSNKRYQVIDGVHVYYVDYISFSNYGKYCLNNICGYIAVDLLMEKLLKRYPIDIIHAHTIGFDGCIAVKLKEKYDIPVVITTHGSDTLVEINNNKGDYIKKICKKADWVVAVSSKLKRSLFQISPSLKVSVISNGYHQLPFSAIEKKPYSILQVGSLIPQKKVNVTISAFAQVLKKYPQAQLEIIGEGEEEKKLKHFCEELRIENSVRFYGFMKNDEVLKHMAQSQIFVMPSINEGFGIVYIEAMSQKCVVVGTKGEGIEDAIIDGENGFLVKSDDVTHLQNIILKCFSSLEYSNRIANSGFGVSKLLTWENNAKKYIQLFYKVLMV